MEDRGLEAWIGREVVVFLTDDSDPWHGLLQDWDERGVVLHHDEKVVRYLQETQGEAAADARPHKPMLILFPWAQVRNVGVFVDDL